MEAVSFPQQLGHPDLFMVEGMVIDNQSPPDKRHSNVRLRVQNHLKSRRKVSDRQLRRGVPIRIQAILAQDKAKKLDDFGVLHFFILVLHLLRPPRLRQKPKPKGGTLPYRAIHFDPTAEELQCPLHVPQS